MIAYLISGLSYIFVGLKWSWDFANSEDLFEEFDQHGGICYFLLKYPLPESLTEGMLKCLTGFVGLIVAVSADKLDDESYMARILIAVYLTVIFSGAVDIIAHFSVIDRSKIKLTSTQCFLLEGVLLRLCNLPTNRLENVIFAFTEGLSWTCAFATSLDKFCGGPLFLLPITALTKGLWFIHGGYMIFNNDYKTNDIDVLWVNLYFVGDCIIAYMILVVFVVIHARQRSRSIFDTDSSSSDEHEEVNPYGHFNSI